MFKRQAPEHDVQFEAVIKDAELSGRWGPALTGEGDNKKLRDSEILWFNPDYPPPTHELLLGIVKTCTEQYHEARPQSHNGMPNVVAYEYSIVRYTEGQAFHAHHSDASPWTGSPMQNRHLTVVMYLNTPEEGGEICFPIQDLQITPERGLVLMHPSVWTHTHYTLPVVAGVKYALVVFYQFENPVTSANWEEAASGEKPSIEEFIMGEKR